jgi:hypothetical protein
MSKFYYDNGFEIEFFSMCAVFSSVSLVVTAAALLKSIILSLIGVAGVIASLYIYSQRKPKDERVMRVLRSVSCQPKQIELLYAINDKIKKYCVENNVQQENFDISLIREMEEFKELEQLVFKS